MKGILLISHGPLAEGMLKTAEIFSGENIPQMKAVVLNTQDDPEDFRGRLQEAVKEVDTGEGVLVFAGSVRRYAVQSVGLCAERTDHVADGHESADGHGMSGSAHGR